AAPVRRSGAAESRRFRARLGFAFARTHSQERRRAAQGTKPGAKPRRALQRSVTGIAQLQDEWRGTERSGGLDLNVKRGRTREFGGGETQGGWEEAGGRGGDPAARRVHPGHTIHLLAFQEGLEEVQTIGRG